MLGGGDKSSQARDAALKVSGRCNHCQAGSSSVMAGPSAA